MKSVKPKIGFLGITQELYEAFLPDITAHQEAYAREVIRTLEDVADFHFPGAARNRDDLERYMKEFNEKELDGVMIVMLTYGPALLLVNALRNNHLPLLLANIQPVPTVAADWTMADLTYNQGIHGAQDTANAIMRSGIPCPIITDDWRSAAFRQFVGDWAQAATTVQRLRRMRIAAFGQMPGMGDVLHDSALMMRRLGPQIDQVNMGEVKKLFDEATDAEVQASMAEDQRNFAVDPRLSHENHAYASRLQVAFGKLLKSQGYDGFTVNFGAVAGDGRFRQLHMLAASNLMAQGYGYAAEGDSACCCLVSAGHVLAPDANFTEMYAMDFERDSALMSHMGEGNWKIARKDRPIRLIDRPLGIGGLENPPTVVFMAQPGIATLADLIALSDGRYRLIVSRGVILDTEEMPNVEMPYFHYKPDAGIRACMDQWLRAGGSHHQCIHLGDHTRRWRMLAELLELDLVEI